MDNLNHISRRDIVVLLEDVGIACFDHEDTETLREALRVNINDGTIPINALP